MNAWIAEIPGTLAGEAPDKLHMTGTKCTKCGRVFFPSRRNCPRCLDDTHVKEIALSQEGTLYSHSITDMAPPGFPPPHAQGFVALGEGLRIFTLLTDVGNGADLRPGKKMRSVIVEVRKDEDKSVMGFRFRPG